jgi:chitinase
MGSTCTQIFISPISVAHLFFCLYSDWEYPGQQGMPDEITSPSDTSNLVLFLRQLRAALPPDALLTAAVPPSVYRTASNSFVRAFSSILDYILLMNYDVWGESSSQPGPNAPLSDACGNSTQPDESVQGGVNAWARAGFLREKILLGVPNYGYLQKSGKMSLRQRRRRDGVAPAEAYLGDNGTPQNLLVNGGSAPGFVTLTGGDPQITFTSLIKQGVLQCSASSDQFANCTASGGFSRFWDSCSSTPFLRSSASRQLVTYDDPYSLYLKAKLARELDIAGVNIFDIRDTPSWDLTDALRAGLGLPTAMPAPLISALASQSASDALRTDEGMIA